ncbi:MAG: hypothetical protein EP338_07975 [Bacteroidetes bacterium]|nr:MAG: hypothetical protein EP338_07975 [Bacteroidota bacterium]
MNRSFRYFLYKVRQYKDRGAKYSQIKHFFRWRKFLLPGANSVRDEQAWITFEAIDLINQFMRDGQEIFEFGGGGSSLFFTKKNIRLYTVEHDQSWFESLQKIMSEKKRSNWTGHFVPVEKGNLVDVPDASIPEHYSSNDENSKGHHYRSYASAIDQYPDHFFDLILVDGRARVSCLEHSINKLKTGGLLVLDNSDRSYYRDHFEKEHLPKFECLLDRYGPSPYTNDFTKTSIWRKKHE